MGALLGISLTGFIVVVWVFTAIATVLTVGRLIVRRIYVRQLYWDDAFQVFAYILLLASSIIYTIIAPAEYHIAAIGAGTLPAPSTEELDAMIIKFFHLEFAVVMLFWACLYSVKFSFLFLFRLIIDGSSKSLKAWDAVAAVLVLSYLASMSVNFAECGPADHFAVAPCESQSVTDLTQHLIVFSFCLNVFSDILVMVLPIPTLWNLNMHRSRKIAVGAIFFLAWVTIAFDILRLAKSETHSGTLLETLYTSLQVEVAVIVSALPSYRVIWSTDSKRARKAMLDPKRTQSSGISQGTSIVRPLHAPPRQSNDTDEKSYLKSNTTRADSSSLVEGSSWSMDIQQTV